MQLRVIIRKDFLEGEAFDSIVYADLIFVENVTHYFLDLIQSPRNPMQHKLLERSAAIHASIFILNTLFVSVNDKIDLQWIERQATETGPRKWDSIAFTRSKNALDAVLIEFSGGLEANSGHSKENHGLPCIKQINDSRPSLPSATYCVHRPTSLI